VRYSDVMMLVNVVVLVDILGHIHRVIVGHHLHMVLLVATISTTSNNPEEYNKNE